MLSEALAKYKEQYQITGLKYCKVGSWIRQLSEEDRTEADALMYDTPMTAKEVTHFLEQIGVVLSSETVRKHRMKECICDQTKL